MSKKAEIDTERKADLYFRIIPTTISFKNQSENQIDYQTYALYLDKGMQVIGKSSHFTRTNDNNQVVLPPNKNFFDFQITSDKNLTYTWSLYQINNQQLEDRIDHKHFSIRQAYDQYTSHKNKNSLMMVVNLDNKQISIKFKIFIQNTADYILKVTSLLLPDATTESILSSNKPKNGNNQTHRTSELKQTSLSNINEDKKILGKETMVQRIINKVKQQNKIQEFPRNYFNKKSSSGSIGIPQIINKESLKQQDKDSSKKLSNANNNLKSLGTIPIQQHQIQQSGTDQIPRTDSRQELHIESELKNISKKCSLNNNENQKIPSGNIFDYIKKQSPQGGNIMSQNYSDKIIEDSIDLGEAGKPSIFTSNIDSETITKINNLKKIGFIILILFLIAGFVESFLLPDSKENTLKNKGRKNRKKGMKKIKVNQR